MLTGRSRTSLMVCLAIVLLSFTSLFAQDAGPARAKYPFEFVELGGGRVDLPSVFAAVEKVKFRGWAVVELDRVPDKSGTPKESAIICKDYLQQRIGVTV